MERSGVDVIGRNTTRAAAAERLGYLDAVKIDI